MALSQTTLDVLNRQGSLTADQQREVAQYNYENPGSRYMGGGTVFIDPTYGRVDWKDVATQGTEWYNIFNPERQTDIQSSLSEAQQLYQQATGAELRGDSLDVVLGHIRKGDTVEQALSNLGNLQWNEMNRDISGEPLPSGVSLESKEGLMQAKSLLPAAQQFANQLPQPQQAIPMDSMGQTPVSTDLTGTTAGAGSSVEQSGATADAAAKSAVDSINERLSLIDKTKTETQKEAGTLSEDIKNLLAETAGKSAFKSEKEKELLDPLEKQLKSYKAQIEQVESEKALLVAQQRAKPITMNSIIGSVAQINAVKDAQILTLTAKHNATIGEIELAERDIDRAVNAKYGPIEEEIAIKQAQLEAITPTLEGDDKAQADALTAYYAQQTQATSDQKEDEKNKLSLIVDAINAGVTDQNVLTKIENATSYAEALKVYAANAPEGGSEDVISLRNKYPDAGILATDTYEQASAKLSSSKIYQQQTRLAGGGGSTTTEPGGFPKGFWSAVKTGVSSLQKGESWGDVWNRLHLQFPAVSNEDLDTALGTEWKQEGAFEQFKAKQFSSAYDPEAYIWQQLAENPDLDTQTKKQWIMTQGFDPEDFNIY